MNRIWTKWQSPVRAVLFASAALCLLSLVQYSAGARAASFNYYGDEPAHFVGALMVRDYISSHAGEPPMQFARNYYVHLPAFGIGMWPPLFYGVAALWMLATGTLRSDLLSLNALCTALFATVLYVAARRRYGEGLAWSAGILLLLVPVVQRSACIVMLDSAGAALGLLALVLFARFLRTERDADILWGGFVGGLAMLTKHSVFFLWFAPPLAIFIQRRWKLIWRPAAAIAAALTAGMYLPWFLLTRTYMQAGFANLSTASLGESAIAFAAILYGQMSFLLLPAIFGLWQALRRPRQADPLPLLGALLIPLAGLGLYFSRVPMQQRLLMPAYVGVLLLLCEGFLAARERGWIAPRVMAASLCALVVAFGATSWLKFPLPETDGGRTAFARFLAAQPNPSIGSILVPTNHEGSWIAALAQYETERPRRTFVRPNKYLAREDWNGVNYIPKVRDAMELQQALERAPVRYVILEDGDLRRNYPHDALMNEYFAAHPELWQLAYQAQVKSGASFRVFENLRWTPEDEPKVEAEMARTLSSQLR